MIDHGKSILRNAQSSHYFGSAHASPEPRASSSSDTALSPDDDSNSHASSASFSSSDTPVTPTDDTSPVSHTASSSSDIPVIPKDSDDNSSDEHVHASTLEFPNGDVSFTVRGRNTNTGWAFCT
jgi:hypothetical protein